MSETTDPTDIERLLERVQQGDAQALGELLAGQRAYLERLVALRMDPRLRARLDPDDVVQQAHLQIVRRIDDYLARRPMPFRLWLRLTVCQCLTEWHRFHLQAECRAVRQEMALPERSSILLAEQLMG